MTDFSAYSLGQVENLCPTTRLRDTLGDGTTVDLVLPRWIVMKGVFEKVRTNCANADPNTCPVATAVISEDFDGAGPTAPVNVTYELHTGYALACADKVVRPLLLHATNGSELVSANPDGTVPLFTTYYRYFCIKAYDEAAPAGSKWLCGKGRLSGGVPGYAVKPGTNSPRTFYAKDLVWGPNTWSTHFAFIQGHIGSIIEKTEPGVALNGYTQNNAWNLNPRDPWYSNGIGKRLHYVGALGLKTTTSRSGVAVSPYSRGNVTLAQSFSTSYLNQCEPGYDTVPDLATFGTLVNPNGTTTDGVLVDLSVAQWYKDSCPWATDWNMSVLAPMTVGACTVFNVNGTGTPRLGLNLGNGVPRRCPSFAACAPGENCCFGKLALGSGGGCAVRADTSLWCWGMDYNSPGPIAQTHNLPQPVVTSAGGPALTGVLDASVGPWHACARRSDGSVWCFGARDGANDRYPVQVTALGTVVAAEQISVGMGATCVVRSDGRLFCWGANQDGALGDGSTTDRSNPVEVTAFGTNVAAVVMNRQYSARHTCARLKTGALHCWGANAYGQLGDGTVVSRLLPVSITALGTNVIDVGLGAYHTCARLRDGTVRCWGRNTYGALGDGTTVSRSVPTLVTALGTSVAWLSVANWTNCARLADGTLRCWGDNQGGQTGLGSTAPSVVATPAAVTSLGTTVVDVALTDESFGEPAYSGHGCARRNDGTFFCWGNTGAGVLASGTAGSSKTPMQALMLSCTCGDGVCSKSESKASCPIDCRVESCGDGKCTGSETEATCGAAQGKTDCRRTTWLDVAVGSSHSCGRQSNGTTWCWGGNWSSQLGFVSGYPYPESPVQVTALGTDVVELAPGESHTCARRSANAAFGTVWCWGDNSYGQIGDGTLNRADQPIRVTALGTNVTAIATAGQFSCVRTSDGSLWCWGRNAFGQLGDGTTIDRLTPVRATALGTAVTHVAIGGDWSMGGPDGNGHACARLANGTLKCWGSNNLGQLGDGTTTNRLSPVAITALGTGVADVTSHGLLTCARMTSGTAACWGRNYPGSLGNGSYVDSSTPVTVTALGTAVAELVAGKRSACARLTTGAVSCWGEANTLPLGLIAYGTSVPSPVQITGLATTVAKLAMHSDHGCLRYTDGNVACWGWGMAGGLGSLVGGISRAPALLSPCGDGICQLNETVYGSCPLDCPALASTCGDCTCDGVLENALSCPADCLAGQTCGSITYTCGNGSCNPGETCQTCPGDCGTCYP